MSRTYEFIDLNGRRCIAEKKGIDNLMPIISERIEKAMPKETVALEDVEQVIRDFRINYKRDITAQEALAILAVAKTKLIEKMEELKRYYVSKDRHYQD